MDFFARGRASGGFGVPLGCWISESLGLVLIERETVELGALAQAAMMAAKAMKEVSCQGFIGRVSYALARQSLDIGYSVRRRAMTSAVKPKASRAKVPGSGTGWKVMLSM